MLFTNAAKAEVSQSKAGYRNLRFPMKVKCINCGRKLQALRPGKYRCPTCRLLIEITEEGRIYLG